MLFRRALPLRRVPWSGVLLYIDTFILKKQEKQEEKQEKKLLGYSIPAAVRFEACFDGLVIEHYYKTS